jgi:hypothetical protein
MWRYILVGHKIEKIRAIQEGRLEEAKASVAQSKAQAREYQARQRAIRAQALPEIEGEPLIQRGGLAPSWRPEQNAKLFLHCYFGYFTFTPCINYI